VKVEKSLTETEKIHFESSVQIGHAELGWSLIRLKDCKRVESKR
jgi:hypothetical protein